MYSRGAPPIDLVSAPFLDESRAGGELAGVQVRARAVGEREEDREGAGLAGDPDLAGGQLLPGPVVPHLPTMRHASQCQRTSCSRWITSRARRRG